jgi:hypothetical protein
MVKKEKSGRIGESKLIERNEFECKYEVLCAPFALASSPVSGDRKDGQYLSKPPLGPFVDRVSDSGTNRIADAVPIAPGLPHALLDIEQLMHAVKITHTKSRKAHDRDTEVRWIMIAGCNLYIFF